MGAPMWAWMALAALLGFEAWLGQTKRVESNSTLALLAKLVPWLIRILTGRFGALLSALGKGPSLLIVGMLSVFVLSGCTEIQKRHDAAELAKFKEAMRVDGAKSLAILEAVAKDAPADFACGAQAVAATVEAIESGNYFAMLGGYSCIPSAAKKLYDDIRSGLRAPPFSANAQMVKAIHDSISATTKAMADIKAAATAPAK